MDGLQKVIPDAKENAQKTAQKEPLGRDHRIGHSKNRFQPLSRGSS